MEFETENPLHKRIPMHRVNLLRWSLKRGVFDDHLSNSLSCKFTPMEFETVLKVIPIDAQRVQIYSDGV